MNIDEIKEEILNSLDDYTLGMPAHQQRELLKELSCAIEERITEIEDEASKR